MTTIFNPNFKLGPNYQSQNPLGVSDIITFDRESLKSESEILTIKGFSDKTYDEASCNILSFRTF